MQDVGYRISTASFSVQHLDPANLLGHWDTAFSSEHFQLRFFGVTLSVHVFTLCHFLLSFPTLYTFFKGVGGMRREPLNSHPETGRRSTMCVASVALAIERSSMLGRRLRFWRDKVNKDKTKARTSIELGQDEASKPNTIIYTTARKMVRKGTKGNKWQDETMKPSTRMTKRQRQRWKMRWILLRRRTPHAADFRPGEDPGGSRGGGRPKITVFLTIGAPESFFFWFLIHFLPIENSWKNNLPKRHPEISKYRPWDAQGSIFHLFWEPFWHPFSWKPWDSRNLLKRNKHRTGALQSPIQASYFGIKNQPKFHVFSGIVFGIPFSHFFKISCQKKWFWNPVGIQLGPKWRPKSAKRCQNNTLFSKMVLPLCAPGTDWLPRSFSERSWAPFWSIWGWLFDHLSIVDGFWEPPGLIFLWFFEDFGIDFCFNFAGRQEPPRTSQEPAKNQAHKRFPQNIKLELALSFLPDVLPLRLRTRIYCSYRIVYCLSHLFQGVDHFERSQKCIVIEVGLDRVGGGMRRGGAPPRVPTPRISMWFLVQAEKLSQWVPGASLPCLNPFLKKKTKVTHFRF